MFGFRTWWKTIGHAQFTIYNRSVAFAAFEAGRETGLAESRTFTVDNPTAPQQVIFGNKRKVCIVDGNLQVS